MKSREALSSCSLALAARWRLNPEVFEPFDAWLSTWPEDERLSTEAFAAHVESKLGDAPKEQQLSHLADLYLAFGAALGQHCAVLRFERLLNDTLSAQLHRLVGHTARADVLQNVLAQLLAAPAGARPRVSLYSGAGSLRAFVGVSGLRAALAYVRKESVHGGERDIDFDVEAQRLMTSDPELLALTGQFREHLQVAVKEAFLELEPMTRTLLRQYYFEQLSVDALAAIHQVHRATTARWVRKAVDALRGGVLARLKAAVGISTSQTESLGRLMRSVDWGVSL